MNPSNATEEMGAAEAAAPMSVTSWPWTSAAVLFAIVSVLFGAIFTFVTPAFWGHDEITQMGRAYQVAHGGFFPQRINDQRGVAYGGQVPASLNKLMGHAFEDYRNNPPEPGRMVEDPSSYRRLENQPVGTATDTIWFTNTAAYSPIPYLVSAVAIRLSEAAGASVGDLVVAARLAGVLFYTTVVAIALWFLRGRQIAWLVFAVALVPMSVFQSGTVTADTMTNAIALLLSVLFIKARVLGDRLSGVESGVLIGSVVALPLCKPTDIFISLLGATVARRSLSGFAAARFLAPMAAVISLGLLWWWSTVSVGTGAGMGLMRPQSQWSSVNPGQQLMEMVHAPLRFLGTFVRTIALRDDLYFNQFFGELGFSYLTVPAVSIVLTSLAIIIGAGVSEELRCKRWITVITFLVVLLSVGATFGALYLGFSPVNYYIIDGVQGRYFLPFVLLTFSVLLRWVPWRLTSAVSGVSGAALSKPAMAVVLLTVGSLLAAVLRYAYTLWH